jgi:2'-5' RNA ligase
MSSYTDKTHILFLDIPIEIASKIDLIRKKYSNSNLKYSAHITLKQDEDFTISSKKIFKLVSNELKNTPALEITLRDIAYIKNNYGYNIYLSVKNNHIESLTRKVSKALEQYIEKKSPRALLSTHWEQSEKYYPHVSIKGTDDKEEFLKLYPSIKRESDQLNLPLKFNCDTVSIAMWSKNKWNVKHSIKLC